MPLVHEAGQGLYGWPTVRNSGLSPQFDMVREGADSVHVPVRGGPSATWPR